FAVRLRPRSAHCRTLAAVQHPKLDPTGIGHPAHQAIQGVDLTDQMALAETADRGIAGHRPDGREAMGYQGRLRTHPRSRPRGRRLLQELSLAGSADQTTLAAAKIILRETDHGRDQFRQAIATARRYLKNALP